MPATHPSVLQGSPERTLGVILILLYPPRSRSRRNFSACLPVRLFAVVLVSFLLAACNSTFTIVSSGFFLAFSTSTVLISQDGTPASLVVTVNGAPFSASSISLVSMPTGVTAQITQPDASGDATIHFVASPRCFP